MHKIVHHLHTLYKSDRRLFAAAILNFLKINPILVFQLAIFLRWPSWGSAVMVIVGGFVGHVVLNIFYMWMLINTKILERLGTYNSIQGCEFHRYSVRDFLGEETYEDLDKHLVKTITPFDFDQIVRIYRVYRPGALMANMQCFATPLFGADIFIPDKPSQTRGISRLFVLHEIGHSLMRIASLEYAAILGSRPYIVFLLWAALFIQWDFSTVFIFVVYMLSMVAWRQEWKRQRESVRLNDEILADGFAFSHIDAKDLQRIASGKTLPRLNDPDLDPLQNLVRTAKFREYLGLALDGRIDDIIADGKKLLPKPQLLVPAVAAILTVMVGCCAPAPSAIAIYCTLGVAVIVTILLVLLSGLRIALVDSFDRLLRSRVREDDRRGRESNQHRTGDIDIGQDIGQGTSHRTGDRGDRGDRGTGGTGGQGTSTVPPVK